MTMKEHYDDEQHQQVWEKLRAMSDTMRAFMVPHAIATAFLGVAVDAAGRYMTRKQLAEWLRGIADELEQPQGRAH